MLSTKNEERKYASDSRPESIRLSTDAPAELSAVVDELLNSLTTKFNTVSSEIFTKRTVDDMSKRLDSLEATLQVDAEEKK